MPRIKEVKIDWCNTSQDIPSDESIIITGKPSIDFEKALEGDYSMDPSRDNSTNEFYWMWDNGFSIAGAALFTGATECAHIDAVACAHKFNRTIPEGWPYFTKMPDFEEWIKWHDEHGIKCQHCEATNYECDKGDMCGNCAKQIGVPYEEVIEAISKKYEERIVKVLERIQSVINDNDMHTDAVTEMSGDEYWWSLCVWPAEDKEADQMVEVALKITESIEYDGSEDGVSFAIDIVGNGGEMIGGLSPYNYTEQCWVNCEDEKAVEERFKLIEASVFYNSGDAETAHLIREFFNQKGW